MSSKFELRQKKDVAMVWGTLKKLSVLLGVSLGIIALLNTRLYKINSAGSNNTCGELLVSNTQTYEVPEPEYLDGARIEHVTFHAPKQRNSQETIARDAQLIIRKNAKATILICHGYMCNKQDILFLRMLFPNFNCMVFDFRAHGHRTSDQCCTFGKHEVLDVIAAAEFLRSHPKLAQTKLFGYGFSMGAVSLIRAQARAQQFDALILDCPFDSSDTVLAQVLGNMRFTICGYEFDLPGRALMMKYAFHPYMEPVLRNLIKAVNYSANGPINTQLVQVRPIKSAQKISVPCFFIHCRNDEKVPLQAARDLYESVRGPRTLWVTEGRHHFDSYFHNPEKYVYCANKFFNDVLSNRLKKADAHIMVDNSRGEQCSHH